MKRLILILLICLSTAFPAVAETVFEQELRPAAEQGGVVFRNYTGPHEKIDSIEQILGIGRFLAASGEPAGRSSDYFDKYRIIHASDPDDADGLDADIFVILDNAGVDHIVNLRRILAGYLQAAYGYDGDQAALLSEFITVYNAVYRGRLDYFESVYKKIVIGNIDSENAGLAVSYEQWPGQTRMIIPLTPKAGTGTAADLDTDVLSDDEVIAELREAADKGTPQRRELIELKEEEVAEERAAVEEEKQKLETRRRAAEQRLEELSGESGEAAETARAETQTAAESPAPDEVSPAGDDAAEADDAARESAERELRKVAEEEQVLAQREQQLDEREERIVQEREDVAADLADEIAESGDRALTDDLFTEDGDYITFLKLGESGDDHKGRLLRIDPRSGKIEKSSEIDSIRLRGYVRTENEILSVAGAEGGSRILSLVKIDPETLEVTASGTVDVHPDSAVVPDGWGFYAVVEDGGWKLGYFDGDLKLTKLSKSEVFPLTEIMVRGNDVIIQAADNSIRALSEDDFAPFDRP